MYIHYLVPWVHCVLGKASMFHVAGLSQNQSHFLHHSKPRLGYYRHWLDNDLHLNSWHTPEIRGYKTASIYIQNHTIYIFTDIQYQWLTITQHTTQHTIFSLGAWDAWPSVFWQRTSTIFPRVIYSRLTVCLYAHAWNSERYSLHTF